jgi:hypothetical protein
MAIKRPAPETISIKRVPQPTSTEMDKASLQDVLIAVTVRDFDRAYLGNYGPTPKVVVDVVNIETGERGESVWFFGNLAKQIGTGLDLGETGLGRIVTGPNKSGNGQWWGFSFSQNDADYAEAESVLS